jgi:hypothetical protein
MPVKRFGNEKYNNQQRLGLGGKGGDNGRLVATVNGMVAAAAATQVQRMAVDREAVQHQW